MNGFLMVIGGFLALLGLVTILVTVVVQIKQCFEECNDELGVILIFLIVIGILGVVIFFLARNAQITTEAYESLHTMYSEVTG